MRAVFLITLVAFGSFAQGRFDRSNKRTAQGRSERGLPDSSGAFLEFAPASGVGMGTACACTTPTGAKGEAIYFARSSVAECYSNDGQTLTQCGVNQPLVSSGTAASSVLGIWAEPARDNLILQSRDLSQAVWTKTNMACTRTATGMRNDANGASTCTASGANGTVIQATVTGAATRNTSFHIKRRTGTGVVEVTRDNGATWTAVTASLSASAWRRVVAPGTSGGDIPGCAGGNCIVVPAMTSAIANPTIGIRIVTSGDAVDVDFVQDEQTAIPSTPIATAGTSLNRAYSVIDLPVAMSPTAATGFSVSGVSVSGGGWFAGNQPLTLLLGNGTVGDPGGPTVYMFPYPITSAPIGAVGSAGVVSGGSISQAPFYAAFSEVSTQSGALHTGSLLSACQRNVCAAGVASTLGTPVFTRALLGRFDSGPTTHFSGVIKQICVDPSSRCQPTRSGPVAWVGDSIVSGVGSSPLDPASRLTELQPARPVLNSAVSGNTIAQCGARYTASLTTGFQTLIWSCGVNDMANGTAGATAATAAQVFLADARARGMKVIVTGIMPWKNAGGWTVGKQTETVAYNSAQLTWAGANGAFYVPTIASMGGGGGDPDVLAVAYDSGDLIHPNVAGALQLATLVFAASP